MKIHKIKKLILATMTVVVFFIAIGLLQSCSNDTTSNIPSEIISSNNDKMSVASKVVKSNEFDLLSKSVESFGKKIKSKYLKLSVSDKQKVKDLLTEISEKTDTVEINELFVKSGTILNIDFKNEMNVIISNVNNIKEQTKDNSVDKRSLIEAIQKNKLSIMGTSTRFKVTSMEPIVYDQNCLNGCYANYLAGTIGCAFLPPPADIICFSAVTAAYAYCVVGCER